MNDLCRCFLKPSLVRAQLFWLPLQPQVNNLTFVSEIHVDYYSLHTFLNLNMLFNLGASIKVGKRLDRHVIGSNLIHLFSRPFFFFFEMWHHFYWLQQFQLKPLMTMMFRFAEWPRGNVYVSMFQAYCVFIFASIYFFLTFIIACFAK